MIYRWQDGQLERSEQTGAKVVRRLVPVGRGVSAMEFTREGKARSSAWYSPKCVAHRAEKADGPCGSTGRRPAMRLYPRARYIFPRTGVAAVWAAIVLESSASFSGPSPCKWFRIATCSIDTKPGPKAFGWPGRAWSWRRRSCWRTRRITREKRVAPLADSQVRILVEGEKGEPNVFVVTSEARSRGALIPCWKWSRAVFVERSRKTRYTWRLWC